MSKDSLTRRSKPLVASVAALAALAALAACGNDSSSGETSGTVEATDGTDVVAPPTSFDIDDIPESMVQMFEENAIFSTFAELVALTDLAPLYEADGEITIFLPGNAAFEKLPAGVLDKLKDPANKEVLTRLLAYHMLDGKKMEMEIVSGTMVTRTGDSVEIEVGEDVGYLLNMKVNGNPVAVGDLLAGKSVAHVIGAVLVPPGLDLSTL